MTRRGSKRGVKRGPYKKHQPRKYPALLKTTTLLGKREYQRNLMRERLGIKPFRFGKRGPKPKRVLLKDIQADLNRLAKRWGK